MQEKWLSYTDQQRAVIMAGLQQSKALGGDSSMAQAMMLAQISSKPTSTLKDVETQIAIKKMEMDHQRFMAEQNWKLKEWMDKVSFEREKETFYSQLDIENVEIMRLKKNGEMIDLHIKIPAATIAKIVMAKVIDSPDIKKLLLDQPEN